MLSMSSDPVGVTGLEMEPEEENAWEPNLTNFPCLKKGGGGDLMR